MSQLGTAPCMEINEDVETGLITIQTPPTPLPGTVGCPFIVEFDLQDPENPKTWKKAFHWWICFWTSTYTFLVGVDISLLTGGVADLEKEFHRSDIVVTLTLSAYAFGFCVGPLFWGPFSEEWGRRPIFLITYPGFIACNIVCALAPNLIVLLVFRFMTSLFGSATFAFAAAVLYDVFDEEDVGLAVGYFVIAPSLGPMFGPIVGGIISETIGWRWCFWIMTILASITYVCYWYWIPETYAPVLLQKMADKRSQKNGKIYRSVYQKEGKLSFSQKLWISTTRPFRMFFTDWISAAISIWSAISSGVFYSLFIAEPIVFHVERGWSEALSGLGYIGVGIGCVIAALYNIHDNKRFTRKPRQVPGQELQDNRHLPEKRLRMCTLGAITLPIGQLGFALTASPRVHWALTIASMTPVGAGIIMQFLGQIAYLAAVHGKYAASSISIMMVLRYISSSAFPPLTQLVVEILGVQKTMIIYGGLSLIFIPIPLCLLRYGESIRMRSPYAVKTVKQQTNTVTTTSDVPASDIATQLTDVN